MPVRGRTGKRIITAASTKASEPESDPVLVSTPEPVSVHESVSTPNIKSSIPVRRTKSIKRDPSPSPMKPSEPVIITPAPVKRSSTPTRRAPSPSPVSTPVPAPAPVKRRSTPTRRAPSPAPAPIKRSSTPTRRAPSPSPIRRDDGREHASVLKRSDTPPRMRLKK